MGKSAVLTPSGMLTACSGDEIVIKCNESDNIRIILRWTISLRNRTAPSIDLSLSNIMNKTERREAGLLFYSDLISYTPLVSILKTTAHPDLNGATVACMTNTPSKEETLTVKVTQAGNYIMSQLVLLAAVSILYKLILIRST